jgi:FkbM family methyltransferase
MRILRQIADLPITVHAAVRAKNLSERIIRRHMQSHFDDAARNGEDWILSILAPSCHSFVDVGGNRGDFTASFLSNSAMASGLVFDPALSAFEKLRARFADRPSVRVIRKAVSDVTGRMVFFEEPNAGLGSSLIEGCASRDAIRTEVEVTTLDAELLGSGGADFVKIDAEGHDLAAIRGAAGLLSTRSFRFIQFEYHATWALAGATLRAALDFCSAFGYHTYLLKGSALYEPNYEAYGEYFSYSNYLVVRPEDVGTIAGYIRGRI